MAPANRHRELRFEKLADIHLELDRIEQAHHQGRLEATGQWTPGQLLGHLAYWLNGAYHGFPFTVPWPIRVFCRLRRKAMIFGRMRPGVRLPGAPGGTLGIEPVDFDEGLRRYREVLNRLRVQPPVLPSPALGDLSHSEWIALTCRHAELHLGYLRIREADAPSADENRPTSVQEA